MSTKVVLGLQWGDEGKGKVVDFLTENIDMVVRYQGGNNAGHTLNIGGKVIKLSALPSGVIRKGVKNLIGDGVVIDPFKLENEISSVNSSGFTVDSNNLMVSDGATLIFFFHRQLDEARENQNNTLQIGTTKLGIGPAYEDRVARRAIRVIDLFDPELPMVQIQSLLSFHNALRKEYGLEKISKNQIIDEIKKAADVLRPYVASGWQTVNHAQTNGDNILFEGAQGVMLDNNFGTYPFVTSSNTLSGQVYCGSGLSTKVNIEVVGVTKAYNTRVGIGPFPTEDLGKNGAFIASKGNEFGTVTSRARRCGWLDLPLLKQACILGGVSKLVLTKIDVLSGLDVVKLGVGYILDGKQIDYLPAGILQQNNVKPVYKEMNGWEYDFTSNSFDDFPIEMKQYISFIEQWLNLSIDIISYGPERTETITRSSL